MQSFTHKWDILVSRHQTNSQSPVAGINSEMRHVRPIRAATRFSMTYISAGGRDKAGNLTRIGTGPRRSAGQGFHRCTPLPSGSAVFLPSPSNHPRHLNPIVFDSYIYSRLYMSGAFANFVCARNASPIRAFFAFKIAFNGSSLC